MLTINTAELTCWIITEEIAHWQLLLQN